MSLIEKQLKSRDPGKKPQAEQPPVQPVQPVYPAQSFSPSPSSHPSTEESELALGKRKKSLVEQQLNRKSEVSANWEKESEIRRAKIRNEVLETNALAQVKREEEQARRKLRITKILYALMIVGCLYLIFLIYGVFCTNYAYNDAGEVAPVVLSVDEIREKRNFDVIKVQYENLRALYEEVIHLDYRLGQGVENPLTLAPEYEALLDTVNDLTVKTDALDVETKYDALKNMMLTWVKEYIAYYLQFVSKGISSNSKSDMEDALKYRDISEQYFALITQNIVTIGDGIAGSDMTGIKNWSPDKYLEEELSEGR